MIRYIIVDDESMAHEIIESYCNLLPNFSLQKNCYNALEALQFLNEHEVDLIFLDLNMPKLKGFDFLRTLTKPPKVIVTTAYSEFAVEGFELNVIDYLLKPFGIERFLKAINKAMVFESIAAKQNVTEISSGSESIFLRNEKRYTQVYLSTILYLEAAGNYTKVIIEDSTILTRQKISELIQLLPQDRFVQVHKSFAVAVPHIHTIEGNRITIRSHEIPIGNTYKLVVDQLLK